MRLSDMNQRWRAPKTLGTPKPTTPYETARSQRQRHQLGKMIEPNPYIPPGPAPNRRPGPLDRPITFNRPEPPERAFRAGPGSRIGRSR